MLSLDSSTGVSSRNNNTARFTNKVLRKTTKGFYEQTMKTRNHNVSSAENNLMRAIKTHRPSQLKNLLVKVRPKKDQLDQLMISTLKKEPYERPKSSLPLTQLRYI